MNIHLWLLRERTKRKLSRSRLAMLADISLISIFRLELSKSSPTLRTLEKIAYALKINVSEMIRQAEEIKQ